MLWNERRASCRRSATICRSMSSMASGEAYSRNASAPIASHEAAIMNPMTTRGFTWHDGERTIRFGRGVAAEAVQALGGPGFLLLTTPRAAAQLLPVADAAAGVHHVPGGGVPTLAADALAWARTAGGDGRVVALGGGRVVDVAKAVAAALGGGARAMAIPTTLSGAEMTRGHRHAEGVDGGTPRVRCAVVVCDPALAASQPEPELAASTLNALGHAVEAPCTVQANPVATLVAHEAARLLAAGWAGEEPDRETLALGALLAGYTLDSTAIGLHHVLAQTLVRVAGGGHGPANAAMLPHTIGALGRRAPEAIAALNAAVGGAPASGGRPDVARAEDLAAIALRIAGRAGAASLRAIGVDPADLEACAEA